jgi:dipeptidyl aminopeptidase/acylaminoacyl peptidase
MSRPRGVLVGICAVSLAVLVAGESGRSAETPLPAATLVSSEGSYPRLWIATKRLDGTQRVLLTRKIAGYERRTDTGATFSPDGHSVAFSRESGRDPSSTWIVGTDGTGLRRVLTLAQARRMASHTSRLGTPMFTPDGTGVVVTANDGCETEAVVRVPLDRSLPVVLWRRPKSAQLGVYPTAFLPDGTVVAIASENDGDCYYGHTGPDRLLLLSAGSAARTLGPPSDAVNTAVVTAGGDRVVWAAGCASRCQLWSADVRTGAARQLTRFRTRTSALSGYDSVSFVVAGEKVIFGRGRSVYQQRLSETTPRRVAHYPCPRKHGCGFSGISSIVVNPEGTWLIVDVTDEGCELCTKGSPNPITERFAAPTSGGPSTKLRFVPFSDLRFD